MKTQRLVIALAGGLLITSIFAVLLGLWFVLSARQGHAAQSDLVKANFLQSATRSLLVDSVEYSKQHPGLAPLLQSWNLLPPAGKTSTP